MKRLAFVCLLFLAAAVFAADKYIDQIQILMTEQEEAEYKKLKSDSEKQKYVESFWSKRDPSPGTPENEYKTNFERNFEEVNRLMKDKRAFESDMGQTLLLLGPPSEQKDAEAKQQPGYGEEEQAAPGKKVWIYKNVPAELASAPLTIEFNPSGGEWRFADRKQMEPVLEKARQRAITLSQSASQQAQQGQQPQQPQQQTQTTPQAGPEGQPAVMSPEVKEALDATATGTAPTDVPMKALADSFMTSTGEVFAAFSIESAGAADGAKVGIRVLDSTGKMVIETEMPFVDPGAKPAEPAGYFQADLPISKGEYSVALAVVANGKTGGVKKSLTVPDYAGKFTLSSIILARSHQQLTEPEPEKVPYTFGKIKVNPNVNRVFSKADELIILYEAYNFKADSNGQPNIDASVAFQKGNEKPRQIPPTPAKGLVTGKKMTIPTSFALSEKFFTPGEWKIIVALTDKVSNETTRQEAAFTIQ